MEGNDSGPESDSEERRLQQAERLRNVIAEREGIKVKLRTKARNQLLADREKIRAFNAGPEDGLDPLKIFPKEMWAMILDQVKDPDTLESAWRTCKLFREFLDARRLGEVVLPTVFQIPLLLDLLDEEKDEEEVDDVQVPLVEEPGEGEEVNVQAENVDEEDGDGNDDDSQTYSNILRIREVCKSWKKGFDLSIQRHLMKSVPRKSLTRNWMDGLSRDLKEEINFFIRAVKIVMLRPFESPLFPPPMCDSKFFKLAGPQLLSLNLAFSFEHEFHERTWMDTYLALSKLLELTPNLISLSVSIGTSDHDEGRFEFPENFNRILELNPIPTLSSVSRLCLKPELPILLNYPFLYLSFLKTCPNIKVLGLDCGTAYFSNAKPLGKIAEGVRSLAHVTSLKLKISANEDIEGVFNKEWKLNHVHLQVLCLFWKGNIVERTFKLLENYKATLETVELFFSNVDGNKNDLFEPAFLSTDLKLNLPKVTNIKFAIREEVHWTSLDFLLPMARLEHLELIQCKDIFLRFLDSHQYDNTLIEFLNETGEWDLHGADSNVWQIFPALKTFVIRREDGNVDWDHPRKWEVTEFTRHGGKRVFYHRAVCKTCERDVSCICSV